MMLKPLFGSQNREYVLIFLHARGEGYATEMARFFQTDLYGIQNQLDRLETGGILVSQKVGRTRIYTFNPRYAFLRELKMLSEKTLSFYPERLQNDLLINRRRPGRPITGPGLQRGAGNAAPLHREPLPFATPCGPTAPRVKTHLPFHRR